MNEVLQGLPLFERMDVCANRHGGSPESRAAFREHRGAFSKQRGMNQISGRFSELKFNHDIFVVRDAANKVVRRDGCAAYRAA